MDSATERALQTAVTTLAHADIVFVLSRGRIIASGTHAELEATSAHHRRMVEAQYTT